MRDFRTPESVIRGIMSGATLNESHAPALKIPVPYRTADAVKVLHDNGVTSAASEDEKTVTIAKDQMLQAMDILDRAVMKGVIAAKPMIASAEALPVPDPVAAPEPVAVKSEPTPPSNGHTFGEESEQIDEISRKTLAKYISKAASDLSMHSVLTTAHDLKNDPMSPPSLKRSDEYHKNKAVKHAIKAVNREYGIKSAAKKLAKEETELNELSYGVLKSYTRKASDQKAKATAIDARIERRQRGLSQVAKSKATKIMRAALGESKAMFTVLNVCEGLRQNLMEGLRLVATHHSDSGKHHAKVYRDAEWGEHRVKFFIHGKHHEPADSFHGDVDDAHGTARMELKRLDKLNGALKEAIEQEEDLSWLEEEFEQIDELSKALLGRYVKKSSLDRGAHEFVSGAALGIHAERKSKDGHGDLSVYADHRSENKKSLKRLKGINRAVDKLVKEEAAEECKVPFQLDEISTPKLKSYIDAAKKQGAMGHGFQPKNEPEFKKAFKRTVGIWKASDIVKDRENPVTNPKVHDLRHMSHGEVYDHTQTHEHIKDGDVLHVKGGAAVMMKAWPTMVHGVSKSLHSLGKKHTWNTLERGRYKKSAEVARSLKKEVKEVKEEAEQIDEVSRGLLLRYVDAAKEDQTARRKLGTQFHNDAASDNSKLPRKLADKMSNLHFNKAGRRTRGIRLANDKIDGWATTKVHAKEEVELSEGKKDDAVAKAKEVFKNHPRADHMYQDMNTASRHHNYIHDACDFVYSNNYNHVKYSEWDDMKPYIEDHFKKHGLE